MTKIIYDSSEIVYENSKYLSPELTTPTGTKIGGHSFARLKRVSSIGTTLISNPRVLMLQMHILCDATGSRNISTK